MKIRALIPIVVVSALLVTGGLLRVSALQPTGLFGVAAYSAIFAVHAALMSSLLPLGLLWFAPAARALHTIVVLLLQAICLIPPLVLTLTTSTTAASASAIAFAVAAGGVVVAGVRRGESSGVSRVTFGLAAAAQCVAWIFVMVGRFEFTSHALFLLVLAVIVEPVLESSIALPAVAAALYAACRIAVRYDRLFVPVFELAAGIVLVVCVLVSLKREEAAWRRWVRGIEAVLFLAAASMTALLGALTPEMHIHDTYFVVAAQHFEGLVLVFALLRDARPQWLGLGLAAAGAQVFSLCVAAVGTRGMPRRYVHYLPQFTPLHRAASIGAFVLLAGLALILLRETLAFRGKNRRETAPESMHRSPTAGGKEGT